MGTTTAMIATTVGLQAKSIDEQKKAARAQRRAQEAQTRMAEASNARQRREQVRQARAARAASAAEAEAMGISEGSAVSGAMGSVSSQLGSNLSFMETQRRGNQYVAGQRQRAADASTSASIFSGLSSMAMSYTPTGTTGGSSIFKE